MKGRKPVPTALKILRGNPGQRPLNHDEPMPDALAEHCPRELAKGEARREWTRTIVPAIRLGLVTSGDRAAAIAHCTLWALWRTELEEAAVAPAKNVAAARAASQKTLRLLLTFDAELGLTPVSRARVKARPPQPVALPNKWAGLLA